MRPSFWPRSPDRGLGARADLGLDRLLRAVLVAIGLWAVYLAIGIAVLRYRLYDIDRLINRTLVYGLLTAARVGVYVAVVKGVKAVARRCRAGRQPGGDCGHRGQLRAGPGPPATLGRPAAVWGAP